MVFTATALKHDAAARQGNTDQPPGFCVQPGQHKSNVKSAFSSSLITKLDTNFGLPAKGTFGGPVTVSWLGLSSVTWLLRFRGLFFSEVPLLVW